MGTLCRRRTKAKNLTVQTGPNLESHSSASTEYPLHVQTQSTTPISAPVISQSHPELTKLPPRKSSLASITRMLTTRRGLETPMTGTHNTLYESPIRLDKDLPQAPSSPSLSPTFEPEPAAHVMRPRGFSERQRGQSLSHHIPPPIVLPPANPKTKQIIAQNASPSSRDSSRPSLRRATSEGNLLDTQRRVSKDASPSHWSESFKPSSPQLEPVNHALLVDASTLIKSQRASIITPEPTPEPAPVFEAGDHGRLSVPEDVSIEEAASAADFSATTTHRTPDTRPSATHLTPFPRSAHSATSVASAVSPLEARNPTATPSFGHGHSEPECKNDSLTTSQLDTYVFPPKNAALQQPMTKPYLKPLNIAASNTQCVYPASTRSASQSSAGSYNADETFDSMRYTSPVVPLWRSEPTGFNNARRLRSASRQSNTSDSGYSSARHQHPSVSADPLHSKKGSSGSYGSGSTTDAGIEYLQSHYTTPAPRPNLFDVPPQPTTMPPLPYTLVNLQQAKTELSPEELQSIVIASMKHTMAEDLSLVVNASMGDMADEIRSKTLRANVLQAQYESEVQARTDLLKRHLDVLASSNGGAGEQFAEALINSIHTTDALAQHVWTLTAHVGKVARIRATHHAAAAALSLSKLNASYMRSKEKANKVLHKLNKVSKERDSAQAHVARLEQRVIALENSNATLQEQLLASVAQFQQLTQHFVSKSGPLLFDESPFLSPAVDPDRDHTMRRATSVRAPGAREADLGRSSVGTMADVSMMGVALRHVDSYL